MGSWKKILVEGDAVTANLGTDNLTQADGLRTYTVGSSKRIVFSDGAVQFSDGSAVSHQVTGGVFDAMSANGIRLSDGDNQQYIDIKPKSEVSTSYTITLPNAAPGSANRILEANATGDLSWIDTPSGSGSGTTINNNADNRVITGSGTANTLEAESDLTFNNSTGQLDVSGRGVFGGHITISPNNNAFQGKTSSAGVRQLIKCNTSGNTEVGTSQEKTVLGGTSVDAGSLQFSCGPATMDQIVDTSINLNSAGDHGEGSVVTYFDTSASNSVNQGRVYYYTGSAWSAAQSSVEAGNKALVGVALGSDESSGFLLRGFVNTGETLTAGEQCFLTTQATITNTVPTSGFSRVMGHSVTTSVMYFNPSQDYLDLA